MSFEAGIFGDFVSPNVTQQGENVNGEDSCVARLGTASSGQKGCEWLCFVPMLTTGRVCRRDEAEVQS